MTAPGNAAAPAGRTEAEGAAENNGRLQNSTPADLEIARQLARAGVPIFVAYPDPESATGYRLPKSWQTTKANENYVNAWKPGHALCAVMGHGLDLVDIDPRHGGDVASLHGTMPQVYGIAATPSGGAHYFVASLGLNSRDGILDGIDYKGGTDDGKGRGFAFIAPTVRVSKTTGGLVAYRWTQPPDLDGIGEDATGKKLADLIRATRETRGGEGGRMDYASILAGLPEGERDRELWRFACSLRARGIRQDFAEMMVRDAAANCSPPYDEATAIDKVTRAYREYPAGEWGQAVEREAGQTSAIFPATDAGNAEMFAALHGDQVRYDHRRGRWLVWHGHRWNPDDMGRLALLAKEVARRRHIAAFDLPDPEMRKAHARFALQSESRQRIDATLALARSEPPIADRGDGWDANPWLLGVQNGVIDLRTGKLREGRQSDRITMALDIPYDPDAECPRWHQFLNEVFGGADMLAFLWRAIGYTLTGSTREQVWFVCHGKGSNGKSVLLNTIRRLLGPLAANLPFSALERGQKSIGGFDLAPLAGRRFVSSSETNEGSRIDESRVKALTGGEALTAAFKYENAFEFVPAAKLWVALNHLPRVDDDTDSFWRRVRLIPFARQFTGDAVDRDLESKLAAELPGILAWAVEGALAWQSDGLEPPATVTRATDAYREDADPLAAFIAEVCIVGPTYRARRNELYGRYTSWCHRNHIPDREMLGERTFGQRIGARFENVKSTGGHRWYVGIGLKESPDPPGNSGATAPAETADASPAAPDTDESGATEGPISNLSGATTPPFYKPPSFVSRIESFLETAPLAPLAPPEQPNIPNTGAPWHPCKDCGVSIPPSFAKCKSCAAASTTQWKAAQR